MIRISGAFDFRLDRGKRLGRVDVGQRRLAGDRHFGDRLGIGADQVAGADVALDRIRSWKKRRDQTTGLPRRPSMLGTTISAPRSGSKARDQPVDQCGVHLRHVAEADDGAVGILGHGGDAGLQRGAEAVGVIRIVHEAHGRPASAASMRSR